MKDVFSSHFSADIERRENLWKNCFFVFDTNVLSSIYKRSDDARDALYKVIISLGERLWIPYQVVHELLDNRASIAHTQASLYSDAISSLRSVLDNLESTTKHPFLPDTLNKDFFEISEKVINELNSRREFHDSRMTNDDVLSSLAEMLKGKVGSRYTEQQLKEIVKEGENRYINKIPPGFEDINKHKGSPVFSEICKRYGDLIIWKQVIDKAKDLKKSVIFVTGEQKDDWWDRHGGKTIGPLPSLIEEFSNEVGQDFYLYSHHQFLELANTYLKQTTSTEVIEEVRDASLVDTSDWISLVRGGTDGNWYSAHFSELSHDAKIEYIEDLLKHHKLSDLINTVKLSSKQSLDDLIAAQKFPTLPDFRHPKDPREIRRHKRRAESITRLEKKANEDLHFLKILQALHRNGEED